MVVYAIVKYTGRNILIVDNCPYCQKTHRHGASLNPKEARQVDSIKDEKERITFLKTNPGTLGSRASHCGCSNGEYTLIFDE